MRSGLRSAYPLVLVCATLVACADSNAPVGPSAPRPRALLEPSAQVVWSEWSVPENLGAVINTAAAEQHPTISKDGLSLYFASDRDGTTGGLDLWVSRRASVDDPWTTPVNLGPNINSSLTDLAAGFSPDGHSMYYHSAGRGGCGAADLFVSRRHDKKDDLDWGVAQNLGCVVNSSAEDAGPTLWTDDAGVTTMMFNSSRPGPGGLDIYQTTRAGDDDEWAPPTLVAELSGPFRDTRVTISRDMLTLFISSDSQGRVGGQGGQDLWMSTRLDTASPWSAPVNLGSIVNGPTFDGAPSLSWDGTELYFFSDRTGAGGFGRNDLYVTRRSRVHP